MLLKKVTQSFGGVSISKPVTTPALAFENNVRKTVSSKGFSHRVTTANEKFTVSDMEEIGGDKVVTLKHEPTKIEKVFGRIQNPNGTEILSFRLVNAFNISELARSALNEKYEKDLYSIYILNNKQVVIKEVIRQYDGTPWAVKIQYKYNETYDPNYAKA